MQFNVEDSGGHATEIMTLCGRRWLLNDVSLFLDIVGLGAGYLEHSIVTWHGPISSCRHDHLIGTTKVVRVRVL